MRTSWIIASFVWSVILVGCAVPPPPDDAPPAPPEVAALDIARRATVLLVTRRPDDKIGYGAGVLLEGEGLVLTNLHLVADARSVRAMLFDPTRTSYTPLDGGLARYLFENEKALVPASLRRADPVLDLAVIEIEADTRALTKLVWRDAPARPGEQVRAVGHPAETVWSFSTGVVSAVHSAAIQTDAAINAGNSGGPLIDATGALLGLNTSKLHGGVQNIGFALPIALARPLVSGAASLSGIDRSTVERAYTTCWWALEHGLDATECIDAPSYLALMVALRAELTGRTPPLLAAAEELPTDLASTREYVRRKLRAVVRPGQDDWLQWARERGFEVESAKDVAREGRDRYYVPQLDEELQLRTGIKVDARNRQSVIELWRMGTRIDRVLRLGQDRAWLELSGRNTDGSTYRVSELWVLRADGWAQVAVVHPDDERTRPTDFPLTETTWAGSLASRVHAAALAQRDRQGSGDLPPKRRNATLPP